MAKQDVLVELEYGGGVVDHTSDVLVRAGISITAGRADESRQSAPSTATLSFSGWRFNPANPNSDLFGLIGRNTPLRITVGTDVRFVGEVSSWKPRQSLGGPGQPPDRWVEVVAADVTRRLGQGADPLQDSLTRWLPTSGAGDGPALWWPLADPPGSASARSNVPGVPPLQPSGQSRYEQPGSGIPVPAAGAPDFGAGDMGPLLSGPFVSFRAGGELTGGGTVAGDGWLVEATIQFPLMARADLPDITRDVLQIIFAEDSLSDVGQLDLNFTVPSDPGFSPLIRLFPAVGASYATASWFAWDGIPHRYGIILFRSFGDLLVRLYIDGVLVASSTQVDTTRGEFGGVLLNRLDRTGPEMPSMGHLAIWESFGSSLPAGWGDAARGYAGEHAGNRVARLTTEEGIPLGSFGALADTIPMGPQHPDGLLALLRECAAADGGMFGGRHKLPGVQLVTGRHLYNQEPALALDYAAEQVAPPLNPVVDDQGTRNDITVTRRDGGQVRVVDQASVDAIGRYSTSATVNVMGDGMVGDQAGWRLHLGAGDGTRFPQLSVDLDATPALAAAVALVAVGDRITVANLPPELTPDLANLQVQGWAETIGSHRRKITYNCSPEEPYHIAEVEHADLGVIGSDSATLAQLTLTETATGFRINCEAGPDWVHEVDFDILIGGERMTVTAVVSAGGTFPNRLFDLTVTRSVNGVVKAHVNDAPIAFFHKSYIGL